ncbi:radial spoke head protein 9 homolog isoform X3 [Sapajus apella]|uniref:Radial spoke head protein 9 homolog n=1 Tax=Sapajus apella TaxID=9515 RepID=A0A6J3JKB9_SAPAP|nr:radial spoke head protein 9 homolog isoform X3 [Sapajus apella]
MGQGQRGGPGDGRGVVEEKGGDWDVSESEAGEEPEGARPWTREVPEGGALRRPVFRLKRPRETWMRMVYTREVGQERSLNCTEWSLLPPATEEMVAQSSVVKGRFMGDPSHEYEHIELQKVNEGEKVFEEEVVVQIKEETRLVYIIDQIDKAVAIIPRGALFKTPFGPTHVNRTFEGLSLSEAKKLSSYFHFREPVELKNKTLLEKADLDPSLDFMDSLEHDVPKGSWSIQMERGNALVVLRSLLWPGLTFYHAPRTKNYGYIYVGTGEKNMDLPFML